MCVHVTNPDEWYEQMNGTGFDSKEMRMRNERRNKTDTMTQTEKCSEVNVNSCSYAQSAQWEKHI